MAAPAFQTDSKASGTSACITLCAPACIACGDLLLAFFTANNMTVQGSNPTICGCEWGLLWWSNESAGDVALFGKIAGGCEPSTYTFKRRGGTAFTAGMMRISGAVVDTDGILDCECATPWYVTAQDAACGVNCSATWDPGALTISCCADDYIVVLMNGLLWGIGCTICETCCPTTVACCYTKVHTEYRNSTFDQAHYFLQGGFTCISGCVNPGGTTIACCCPSRNYGGIIAWRKPCSCVDHTGTPCAPPVLESISNCNSCGTTCFVIAKPTGTADGDLLVLSLILDSFSCGLLLGCGTNCECWGYLDKVLNNVDVHTFWKKACNEPCCYTFKGASCDIYLATMLRISAACVQGAPSHGLLTTHGADLTPAPAALTICGLAACSSNLFLSVMSQDSPNSTKATSGPIGYARTIPVDTGTSERSIIASKAYVANSAKPRCWVLDNNAGSVLHTLGVIQVAATGCCTKKVPTVCSTSVSGAGCTACSTAFSLTAPSGVKNNDLIILAVGRCVSAGAITGAPAGFTNFLDLDATQGIDMDLYYKRATSSEPCCYCFTSATSDSWVGMAWRIKKGCGDTAPFIKTADGCSSDCKHIQPEVWACCQVAKNYLAINLLGWDTNQTPSFCRSYTESAAQAIKVCAPILGIGGASKPLCNAFHHQPGIVLMSNFAGLSSLSILVAPQTQKVKNVNTNKGCEIGSLAFTIPSCVLACDLLFIMIQRCCLAGGLTWPCGWTSFFSEDTANGDLDLGWHPVASACEACCVVTVCFSTTDVATGHMYHMRNTNICNAPLVSASAVTGTSVNPDSPCLTVCVVNSYIAVTFIGGEGDITVPATYPACHTAGATVETVGCTKFFSLSSYSTCAFCGTANNPAAYTISASLPWTAITVFVEPLACCVAVASLAAVGRWKQII